MKIKYLAIVIATTLHCGTYRPQTQTLPTQKSQQLGEAQLFKPATRHQLWQVSPNPGSDIAAQLQAHNAKLTAVYFTHMHVEHTAGAPALPKDIPYIAGKGTLANSYADIFGLCMKHLDGIEAISEIDFSAQPEVAGLGRVFDIFGDGTVWAIHTPGHSAGHMSFLVNTKEGAFTRC